MSIPRITDKLQAIFTITGLINVYQPLAEEMLYEKLEPIICSALLKEVLKELVYDKRIISKSGHYRITRKGEKLIPPGKPHLVRDINRMFHLIECFKKGRCSQ